MLGMTNHFDISGSIEIRKVDIEGVACMWLYHRVMSPKDADRMSNSVDPDQTAPLGAVWSGSALFAQAYLSENLETLRYPMFMFQVKSPSKSQTMFQQQLGKRPPLPIPTQEPDEVFEPCQMIMVLFVLRKLILQTRMRSHPVGLDVWFLVEPFVYFHISCVWTAKAFTGCLYDKYHHLMSWLI